MSDRHRTAPTDPVEAEMAAAGEVLHREKVVARNLALLCLLLCLGFSAASFAYLRGWQPNVPAIFHWLTYALVPFFAWIGLTKTVLRTVVTTREVHVQQGLRGVRIPIAGITRCAIFAPPQRPVGGTELYAPMGATGVSIEWRDERGKDRKALIGSTDSAALFAVIEQARAGKTRIAIADAADAMAQSSEAEGEGDEASRRARTTR